MLKIQVWILTQMQKHEMDIDNETDPMDVDDDFFSDDTVCDGKDSDYFPENRIEIVPKVAQFLKAHPQHMTHTVSAVLWLWRKGT